MKRIFLRGGLLLSLSLVVIWFVNNILNERQLNKDLAIRFDETMVITYPFLENVARALYLKADILEKNASYAHKYYPLDYTNAFQQLNIMSSDTEEGRDRDYWIGQYGFFLCTGASGILEHSGDLRKSESKAFFSLLYAYKYPESPLEMDYDSLIDECNTIKMMIRESMQELKKYSSSSSDVDSWRYVDQMQYRKFFDRYFQRKNWPFNLIIKMVGN